MAQTPEVVQAAGDSPKMAPLVVVAGPMRRIEEEEAEEEAAAKNEWDQRVMAAVGAVGAEQVAAMAEAVAAG